MALTKNNLPILEYDDNQKSIFSPLTEFGEGIKFPKKAVFAFLRDEIDIFAEANNCDVLATYTSITKNYNVYSYEYEGEEVCLLQAPMGAPAATALLEFLICFGVEKIISAGSCGALVDLPENEFLIPVEALRQEGVSFQYLPPSETVSANPVAVSAIKSALKKNGIKCAECKVWTTDALYRETVDMVEHRKNQGYSVVDMEASALMACSQFRGVTFGQMLFTADTLADIEKHDMRSFAEDSFSIALKFCLDALIELD